MLDQLDEAEEAFAGWSEIYPSAGVRRLHGRHLHRGRQVPVLAGRATAWSPASSGSTGSTRTAAGRWCWRPTASSAGAASSTSPRPRTYAADAGVVVHVIANPGEPDGDGDIDGLQAAADETGGTFSQLGTGGSAAEVVEEINELEATEIERPPLVQTLDEPRTGQVIAGIGVGLLVLGLGGAGPDRARRTEVDGDERRTALLVARRVGIVVALVAGAAAARDSAPAPRRPSSSDIEVLVVVDRTRSMAALDYQDGPRIYGVAAGPDRPRRRAPRRSVRAADLRQRGDPRAPLHQRHDHVRDRRRDAAARGSLRRQRLPRRPPARGDARRSSSAPTSSIPNGGGWSSTWATARTPPTASRRPSTSSRTWSTAGSCWATAPRTAPRCPRRTTCRPTTATSTTRTSGEDAISRIDEDNLQDDRRRARHRLRSTAPSPVGWTRSPTTSRRRTPSTRGTDAPAKHDLTWLFGLILLGLVLLELRSWWRAAVDLAHHAAAGPEGGGDVTRPGCG